MLGAEPGELVLLPVLRVDHRRGGPTADSSLLAAGEPERALAGVVADLGDIEAPGSLRRSSPRRSAIRSLWSRTGCRGRRLCRRGGAGTVSIQSPAPGRAVTPVDDAGERVAVIVHDERRFARWAGASRVAGGRHGPRPAAGSNSSATVTATSRVRLPTGSAGRAGLRHAGIGLVSDLTRGRVFDFGRPAIGAGFAAPGGRHGNHVSRVRHGGRPGGRIRWRTGRAVLPRAAGPRTARRWAASARDHPSDVPSSRMI